MCRALFFAWVLSLSGAAWAQTPAAEPAPAVSSDELARYAEDLFSRSYAAGEPGAAVLVARDGKVLLRKGYGLANLELGVPVQPDMVFEIGSLTKQFTAAAILLLQERGKLAVGDEVTRYLPDYPTHGQKITLHHLLTHTSGIPDYTGLPAWWPRRREDLTVQQLLDLFKDEPLAFTPGEKTSYSSSAYVVLGAVIEKVSGKSYEDFVEQEIFAPLGMKRSRYGHQEEVVPGRAAGYDRDENGYRVAEYLSLTQPYAAGALSSTVDDLALWAEALAGGKLLKKASLEQMTTPATLTSGKPTKAGYGLVVAQEDGTRIVEHGGGIPGFASHLLVIPDQRPDRRLVVVILANRFGRPPGPGALAYRIAMKALGRPVEGRQAMRLDPATLDEYADVYRLEEDALTILREGDRLFVRTDGGEKKEILAASRDDFFYPDSPGRLHFRRDAQGKITALDFQERFGPADGTAVKAAGALAAAVPLPAASPAPPPVDGKDRAAIIDDIAAALRENYVFPDLAAQMEKHLRQQLASAAYDRLGTLDAFVQKLTEDLRSVSHDQHLAVRWDPEPSAPEPRGPTSTPEEQQALIEAGMRRENYWFRKVERLAGNVGYLKIDRFAPTDLAGSTASAAMGFLAGSDALIIDLRDNSGAMPGGIGPFLASYLFSQPTHLGDMYNRMRGETRQVWTQAWVPGARLPDVPVFILTSHRTFSGGEELAYDLKHLKRATIVGETTGGGANPAVPYWVEGYPVLVSLPVGRPINPITGTNWEGTGVEPDVPVAAPEALAVAHERALAALAEKAGDPAWKAELEFLRGVLQDRRRPASPSAAELQACAGTYGPVAVTWEGGALWYRSGNEGKLRLLPVGKDSFLVDDRDDVRVRCERDASGRAVRLVAVRPGREEPHARGGE